MIGCFDAVDGPARKVDEPRGAFERALPISQRASIPADMPPRPLDCRRIAREDHDQRASCRKVRGQRRAQETAAAGDHDRFPCEFRIAHGSSLTDDADSEAERAKATPPPMARN